MENSLGNAPTTDIVKQVISFLQWLFSKSALAPPEYKWDADDKRSLIRISKSFSTDDSKSLSRPSIVVTKGAAVPQNRVLDNLVSANKNVFDEPVRADLVNMNLMITVNAGAADEASNLLAFAVHNIHMHRHKFSEKIDYIHEIRQVQLNPEQPVANQVDSEIHVWEATGVISAVLIIGWYEAVDPAEILWETMEIRGTGVVVYESETGQVFKNSSILKDTNALFGSTDDSIPQLTTENVDKGFYFIVIEGQPYMLKNVVNNNMLRLAISNEKGDMIDFAFDEERNDVSYKIHWNKPYIRMVVPNKNG